MFHVKHRQSHTGVPMICRFLGCEDAITGEKTPLLGGRTSILMPNIT
jgi:hypothetical protein